MKLYSLSSEETLRARKLLADWAGEGLITQEQYQRLEQETVSELRTTNIFLRLILFLFTLISVGALAALFFRVFLVGSSEQTFGIFLLIYAGVCYAAAEVAVSQALWSKNSSSLPRKGSLPDRRLMPLPAHSTSADHPVVPCNAQFRYPRSPLDSARGTAAGSACPGDCAPRGNGPRIAAGLGAAVVIHQNIVHP